MKFIILALFIHSTVQVCIQNIANNDTWANVTGFFNDSSTSYCAGIITYPISDVTAYTATARNAVAKANYKIMADKWKNRSSTNDDPTNDCLGVARTFFCTQAFPACSDDAGDGFPMCDFLCTLWIRRCPQETAFYNQYCYNAREENCSFAGNLSTSLVFIMLSLTLYLFLF